jgi:DNA polymerase III alpha subunit
VSRRGLLAIADVAVERRQDLDKLKDEIAKLEAEGPAKAKALAGKRKKLAEVGAYTAPPPWLLAPELPDTIRQVLTDERETLGQYVSGHPIEHLSINAPHSAEIISSRGADENYVTRAGTWVELAGVICDAETRTTRRGNAMANFGLECLDGVVRCLSFSENAEQVANGWVVRAKGVIEDRESDRVVKVTKLQFVERW